jgi:hypothetical protein
VTGPNDVPSPDSAPAPRGGDPRVKPVAVWPIALMGAPAFVAIWSGWSELGLRAGLGRLTIAAPISVLALVTATFLTLIQADVQDRTGVRRLWVWTMLIAAAGTAYGVALRTGQTGRVSVVLACLVWLTPLACVLAGTRLYLATRKEDQ